MTYIQAMRNLMSGKNLTESVNVVDAEVAKLCKTSTDGLNDWLGNGDYSEYRSPADLAREWDSLTDR